MGVSAWGVLFFEILLTAAAGSGDFQVVATPADKYRDVRLRMVEEELVREGIKNPAVLDSMRKVPRHMFVAPELRPAAYFDQALPIGSKQTISPPFIVAYMTEMLDPQPADRVLEIGTGSGYQAAVLSGIVKEVYTIEIVEPLGRNAAKVLREQGFSNVQARVGDGYLGWPEKAPFDKIIVTCSPEKVPVPLVEQLKEGGRMIVPLGERYEQVFYLFEKRNGELTKAKLLPALFVPMTGISEEKRQVLPDPSRPQVRNGGFEIDSDKDGHPDGWHYQRQLAVMHQLAPEGKSFVTFENVDPGHGAQMLQGMAVDGSKVGSLEVRLQVRGANLKLGPKPYEKPSLILQFYDGDRRPLPEDTVGPWQGSFNWKPVTKVLHVPPRAREAILRVGLNGGTGTLSIDDIRITPVPR